MNNGLIIYIAGYGRSGSTALDLALSAVCEEAIGCGEVGMLPKLYKSPRLGCSCGAQYPNCSVWSPILRASNGVGGLRSLTSIYTQDGIGGYFKPPSKSYVDFWADIFGKRCRYQSIPENRPWVAIDSTKTVIPNASRPYNLSRLPGIEVVVVHLKRDLRGVLSSRRKGKNSDLEGLPRSKHLVAILSRLFWPVIVPTNWFLANFFARVSKKSRTTRLAIDVDFRELRANPEDVALRVWQEIAESMALPLSFGPTRAGYAKPDHLVEGNRFVREGHSVSIRSKSR